MKKKLILLFFIILLSTGCSVSRVDNKTVEDITKNILSKKSSLKNSVHNGYSYYIPKGLKVVDKKDYNTIFKDKYDNTYYLYVDVVSYFNKVENNYENNTNIFYSKKLKYNNKKGYLEISKDKNKYFIQEMFNYAKVEVYTDEEHLEEVMTNTNIMLNSVKFNRKVLGSLIGSNSINYKEEIYNIFSHRTNDNKDYLEAYQENKDAINMMDDSDNIRVSEED